MQSIGNAGSTLTTLKEVTTVIPDTRIRNNEAYSAFGFEKEKTHDGAVFTGAKGTRAWVIARDFFKIGLPGHAILRVTLAAPVDETRVESIVDGSLSAIYEGSILTLVLTPDGAAIAADQTPSP